jgi:predicted small metal-binding protein
MVVKKAIQCDCGFEASGHDEEELVAEVRRHAREAHGMALSHDDALLLAFRAELDAEAPVGPLRGQRSIEEKEDR